MNEPEDLIWVEEIEDNAQIQPLVVIYKHSDGGISFKSVTTAVNTARILTGLAHHILENHVG